MLSIAKIGTVGTRGGLAGPESAVDEVLDETCCLVWLLDPRQMTSVFDAHETSLGEVSAQLSGADSGARVMTPMDQERRHFALIAGVEMAVVPWRCPALIEVEPEGWRVVALVRVVDEEPDADGRGAVGKGHRVTVWWGRTMGRPAVDPAEIEDWLNAGRVAVER